LANAKLAFAADQISIGFLMLETIWYLAAKFGFVLKKSRKTLKKTRQRPFRVAEKGRCWQVGFFKNGLLDFCHF
jgi:hypothetical protein